MKSSPRANVGCFALASCSALVSEIDVVRRRASLAYSSLTSEGAPRNLRSRAFANTVSRPSLAKSSVLRKVDKINLKINFGKLKSSEGRFNKIFTPGRNRLYIQAVGRSLSMRPRKDTLFMRTHKCINIPIEIKGFITRY